MTSFFEALLDTATHVVAQINGGKSLSENSIVTLELELDADAIEVKVWGDINPLDPANSEFGEDEASAPWITASPSFLVALTTNPGKKQLAVRVKDDVWNEATATDSIFYSPEGVEPEPESPPYVPPSQAPRPVPGKPEPTRPLEAEQIIVSNRPIHARAEITVSASLRVRERGARIVPGRARIRAATETSSTGFKVSTRVRSYIRRDVSAAPITIGAETEATVRRDDGPDTQALIALELL